MKESYLFLLSKMMSKNNISGTKLKNQGDENKYLSKKHWDYRKYEKKILSALTDALILHTMKTGNNGKTDLPPLKVNEEWQIVKSRKITDKLKGPVDVSGEIEKINILNIQRNLIDEIQQAIDIKEKDKEHYINAIKRFVSQNFYVSRKNLEKKEVGVTIHWKFRKFYTVLALQKKGLSREKQLLYRDICLTLANLLYEKNHDFLDRTTGEINQKGLEYLGAAFFRTMKHTSNSGSSKAVHKIFHDGDLNFLGKKTSTGKPVVGKLDHYVQAILYLLDPNSFNAYWEGGEDGAKEWAKSKKSFINNLFVIGLFDDEKNTEMLDKKIDLHEKLAKVWGDALSEIGSEMDLNRYREACDRFKTEESKILKVGGRTSEIKDESGLRLTYYGPENGEIEDREKVISAMMQSYIKKLEEVPWIRVKSVMSDRKGEFISSEGEDKLLALIQEEAINILDEEEGLISKRVKSQAKKSQLERLIGKYQELTKKKPTPGMQQAYKIANGEIIRGSNGDYKDFKLLMEYRVDHKYMDIEDENYQPWKEDVLLSQEISFYPRSNELNMGNHHILDLEKKIFNRVKNMNDPELGKSISLNRLRYFTEATIKAISFDIEMLNDKIERWDLPKPENDNYTYLEHEGQKISLEGLVYRNQENSERFDQLITLILNYFIKKNKIVYINNPDQAYYGLVKPEMLHDDKTYKLRRFTTSDVLRHTALDARHSSDSIALYTDEKDTYVYPNFYVVSLGDLGDFIGLENHLS